MSEKKRFIDARRRGFLKGGAAVAGVAATGAAIAHQHDGVAPEEVVPTEAVQKPGYQVTDHVREYYAKARF